MKRIHLFALACCATFPLIAAASCGSAFCTVNTNWTSESAAVEAGSSYDLRYEYLNQDQPRTGTSNIAVGQIPHHHDEVQTINRNVLATFSHNFASGWGVSVVAPILDREHTHIHNHRGERVNEQWNFTEVGDVRVIGRYQLPFVGDPSNPSLAGITFGVKLPTGTTGVTNAEGSLAERSLQPGTGTTDLVLGAYYHQSLVQQKLSWFAQAQVQQAIKEHDGYKPGTQFGADVGVRYAVTDKLGVLAQLNFLNKRRDRGAEAEPDDSGSRSVFLSPGIAYTVTDSIQVYGFYQRPIYQHVNGVQLVARNAFVVGISGKF